MSAWIEIIPQEAATGALKRFYDLVRTPHGTVDNVMRVHSLRPATMEGHVTLYRSVLHNPDNTLALWFLEVVACYTSILNNCDYSLTHHFANAKRLINDTGLADAVLTALKADKPEDVFVGKELALLRYAGKLTLNADRMIRSDLDDMRQSGCSDGEILEVNQVCAYFNYANRLLNGLGVSTQGDVVGYYDENTT